MQLKRRLEKLEAAEQSKDTSNRIEIQIGYCRNLPPDYVGERHIVEVSRLPNGHYWEEKPGPELANEGKGGGRPVRVIIVSPIIGTPDELGDTWREPRAAEEGLAN